MAISNLTLMRATALFTAVGLAVLLGMVALSFWMLERTRVSTEDVLATRGQRSALVDLLSIIQDAEIGQRGYLLTGEDGYLKPYEAAVSNAGPALNAVTKLLPDDDRSRAFDLDVVAYE